MRVKSGERGGHPTGPPYTKGVPSSFLPNQTTTQTERENASRVKPPGDVQASVVVLMTAVLPERSWSLFN
ncbi:hypothetical protein AVEN_189316-1 [Araneus ventricosus]|uniref:Uncharacterized protein n=1 Tax=Araneus ventricosus TaxID=182803 RepID=A0A4Y2QDE6_ARAVE|nr:hypothetical protein AVEN_189316-1 [Araneus ventricosus]